jgi:hypothetical protein
MNTVTPRGQGWLIGVSCPFSRSLVEGIIANTVTEVGLVLKSASEAESMKIPAALVPAQSDHSPRCGNVVCSPNIAPSFALRRVPIRTESAPVHRRPDGKGGRKFDAGRAARERESHGLNTATRYVFTQVPGPGRSRSIELACPVIPARRGRCLFAVSTTA